MNADQDGDDELEEHDRLPVEGVPHRKEDEDVRAGQQHAGVERDPGEEQAYCDGGAEQLGEVGGDDGELGEDVERVEEEPAVEEGVPRAGVEEEAAVGCEVYRRSGNASSVRTDGQSVRAEMQEQDELTESSNAS